MPCLSPCRLMRMTQRALSYHATLTESKDCASSSPNPGRPPHPRDPPPGTLSMVHCRFLPSRAVTSRVMGAFSADDRPETQRAEWWSVETTAEWLGGAAKPI